MRTSFRVCARRTSRSEKSTDDCRLARKTTGSSSAGEGGAAEADVEVNSEDIRICDINLERLCSRFMRGGSRGTDRRCGEIGAVRDIGGTTQGSC